jgi:hypothetical protein
LFSVRLVGKSSLQQGLLSNKRWYKQRF